MATPRHITVSEESRPVLPRHAKLKFDETRQVWVILAPERVLAPDEIAVEVLQLCDGVRSVAQMIDQLTAKYAARGLSIGNAGDQRAGDEHPSYKRPPTDHWRPPYFPHFWGRSITGEHNGFRAFHLSANGLLRFSVGEDYTAIKSRVTNVDPYCT